jgi:hypothetical protein
VVCPGGVERGIKESGIIIFHQSGRGQKQKGAETEGVIIHFVQNQKEA